MQPGRSICALAAVTALSLALSACVVEPARVRVIPEVRGEVIYRAPPAVIVENYGPAPAPGYVWINGYWNWVGGRHVWVAGRWSEPRSGYVWVPHRWVQAGGGWRLHEGYWAPARR